MNSLQECTSSSEVSNTKHSTDEKNDSGVPSSGSPRSLRNFSYKPILWSAGGRAGARLAIWQEEPVYRNYKRKIHALRQEGSVRLDSIVVCCRIKKEPS